MLFLLQRFIWHPIRWEDYEVAKESNEKAVPCFNVLSENSALETEETTIPASYLESCLPSCHSVCPAASRSREQAFY
jgi:hypothetical protein